MQQDYILRMVQQFSGFLIRVVRLRREGKTEEALEVIAEAYGKLVGVPASLVHALSEDDLIELLRARGRLDVERCLGLAELLREEARTYEEAGQEGESYQRYLKALRLYLEIIEQDDEVAVERMPGLNEVIERITVYELPLASERRLVSYLEGAGRFDDAENLLLQRIDLSPDDPSAVEAARAFYRRLIVQPDAALLVGGLTRDEVSDALLRLGGAGSEE